MNTPCQPNPCFNDGKCKGKQPSGFECFCSGTLYTGMLCNIGIVQIPSIPQLFVNVESEEIIVYARPTGFITITPVSKPQLLEFIPPSIRIDSPNTKSSFKMITSRSGMYSLKFKIDGMNQFNFESPEEKQIHVFSKKISIMTDLDFEFLLERSCNSLDLENGLDLLSTCQINSENFETPGFTSIKSKSLQLPLSIAGLDKNIRKDFHDSGTLDPSELVEKYMASKHTKTCSRNCHNVSNIVQIEYALQNKFFQKIFIHQVSKRLPSWLELYSTESDPDYNTDNLLTKVLSQSELYKAKGCSSFKFKEFPIEFSSDERINVYYSSSPTLIKVLQTKLQITDFARICFLTGLDSSNVNILSSSPMKIIETPSQYHVIEKLQSSFVSILNDSSGRVLIDVLIKMKTFNGKFQAKCLLSWNDSEKV